MTIKMALVISIGVYGGIKLDEYIAIKFPVFTIVFSLIGVALAIYIVVKDTSS